MYSSGPWFDLPLARESKEYRDALDRLLGEYYYSEHLGENLESAFDDSWTELHLEAYLEGWSLRLIGFCQPLQGRRQRIPNTFAGGYGASIYAEMALHYTLPLPLLDVSHLECWARGTRDSGGLPFTHFPYCKAKLPLCLERPDRTGEVPSRVVRALAGVLALSCGLDGASLELTRKILGHNLVTDKKVGRSTARVALYSPLLLPRFRKMCTRQRANNPLGGYATLDSPFDRLKWCCFVDGDEYAEALSSPRNEENILRAAGVNSGVYERFGDSRVVVDNKEALLSVVPTLSERAIERARELVKVADAMQVIFDRLKTHRLRSLLWYPALDSSLNHNLNSLPDFVWEERLSR